MNPLFLSLLVIPLTVVAANPQQLPNPNLTPGKADPTLTKEIICSSDFRTGTIRNVTQKIRNQVYKNYNVENYKGYCSGTEGCEVDHLISLELGGSNDIQNLWPQSYVNNPNTAHDKDKLENKLHKLVCSNKISLLDAQTQISKNWISAYTKYIK